MKFKVLLLQFSIFALVLLFIIPLWFSTFLDIHYIWSIRASFFFLIILKLGVVSSLLWLFILRVKLNKFKGSNFNWKWSALFIVLAFLCFLSAFSTQVSMSDLVSEGVFVNEEIINFDGGRIFGYSLISDKGEYFSESIDNDFMLFKKTIFIDDLDDFENKVIWHGYWEDADRNGVLGSNVFLDINNHTFNVTVAYSSLPSKEFGWMGLEIPAHVLLTGKNELVLYKKGVVDYIALSTQDIYQEANSFTTIDSGASWQDAEREFLLYVKKNHSFGFTFLFKLGFVFKILGIIFLFIAIFGFDFSKFIVRRGWLELILSTIFAYWVWWFSEFIQSLWKFFAFIVAKSLYFIFFITGFHPVIMDHVQDGVKIIGIKGFMVGIYGVCSGVDSLGLFILLYVILVLVNLPKISVKRALLLFIPGLIGTFLLNLLRVYLIIIVGAFISKDFAINSFHTNIGIILFLVFFFLFWFFAFKFMKKK
ncbi:archaeosortase/exosortase family protein [Candidatus Woesearchaeota archaeon]|nr:archaeosortase/exosortase family protein [Candidatus Woesearchaeota archaeon]